jgi:hypothetical protein
MRLPLEQLAEVRIGLTLRGADAARQQFEGGPHFLRISDLTENGKLEIRIPHPMAGDPDTLARFKVLPQDVVLASRGNRLTAALIEEPIDAVVGGQLFLIRTTSNQILPEFLHAYLNLPATQASLLAQTVGSSIQTLPASTLRAVEIPVPSLEIQRTIVALTNLQEQENDLLARISTLRSLLVDKSITRLLEKSPA